MAWLKTVWSEFLGLFVDDGSFAVSTLLWLAACWLVLPRLPLPPAVPPLVLFFGLALILVESALRRSRQDGQRVRETLCIAAGGALGSMARYWLALWALPLSERLPWGTIGINVAGSFLIGFFGTLTLASGRHPLPESARLFVMVGFCGGFTPFSSFSLQTLDLLRGGAWGRALLNINFSVALCLAAVAIGHGAAARLNSDAVQVAQTAAEEEAS